jgi:SAM-dependent methyltransferase
VSRDEITRFERNAAAYDRWFDDHPAVYRAELAAVRRFIPTTGRGLEIGVGSGRFAAPLGVTVGVDPAWHMAALAQRRGVLVCCAMGEVLPFRPARFDFALLVTVICFVADVPALLREARRILRRDGSLTIAFINRDSALGRRYKSRQARSEFYRGARFYSPAEVATFIRNAGFTQPRFCRTLLGPREGANELEVRDGYGTGGFVVASARRIG